MTKIKKNLFLVVVFLLFLIQSSVAKYFFQHFTIDDGLPNNTINKVFKDSQGFLWICTSNGLSQYDGYTFRNFYNNPKDTFSLPNNYVRSITEDKSGILWVGMWGGVATFNRKTQQFKRMKLSFESNYDKVFHIFCDSKDRIWVSTSVGNYLFSNSGDLIKHWKAGKGTHDLPHNDVVCTFEDKSGNIWITGRCGLCRFRESSLDYEVFSDNNPPYIEGNDWRNSLLAGTESSDGTLWYGSWANGLRRIDPVTKNFTSWLTKPEFAGHGAYNVISGTAEFDGKIWVASHDQGLGYLDVPRNKLFFLRELNLQGYSMPSRFADNLFAEKDILWIGTRQGLYKYDLRKQLFEVLHFPNIKQGSCLPEINTVSPGNKNNLLVGTWTCGLFAINPDSAIARKINNPFFGKKIENLYVDIQDILKAKDSTLWYATSHGLWVENKTKKQLIRPLDNAKGIARENYFYKLLQTEDGMIWAATAHGILKFNAATWEFTKLNLEKLAKAYIGKAGDEIVDISLAPNGDIWFLRRMGGELFQVGFTVLRKQTGNYVTYVAGRGLFKNYPTPQTAFAFKTAKDGNIYIASERGLVSFNGVSPGRFQHYTTYHGLLADKCFDLEEDTFGNIWVLSVEGLTCYNPITRKFKTYTKADGIPEAGLVSCSRMPDGEIAIGLDNGWLAFLKPQLLQTEKKAHSNFKFTGLEIDNQYFWPYDSIQLSQGDNLIKFSFSPLNFFTPADIVYQISIKRSDQLTNYKTPSNQILLSDLRPGWYQIKVSAPGLETISIEFYKQPWFWQTTWFLILCIVAGFGLITIILLLRQRKILEKQAQELNLQFQIADMQMTALRSQIDAHFIFNALNAINNFIWQKLPEQAADYLTQFARLMRINLEHTRTDWVTLSEELNAVQYYFNLEALSFDLTPQLEVVYSDEINADSVYIPPMLLQPIVENVFKHGFQRIKHQGKLRLEIGLQHSLLTFIAYDNGAGPVESTLKKTHKSLASVIMNERLQLLNRKLGTSASFMLDRKEIDGQMWTVSSLTIPYQYTKNNESN